MEILTSSPHVILQDTDFNMSMYVHGYFPCMYTFTPHASLVLLGAEVTRSLEPKSQTAVSCHLGARETNPYLLENRIALTVGSLLWLQPLSKTQPCTAALVIYF